MFWTRSKTRKSGESPPRVVILGAGYGGVYTGLGLQKAARRRQIELVIVNRENYFAFQPLLAEVISGSIEPLHVVNPTRRLLPAAHFYQAEIVNVDADERTVRIRHKGRARDRWIPYDHLVIAIGSSTDMSRLPGVEEHGFRLKTLGDAFFLRNHLIGMLEQAAEESDPLQKKEMLTFVVAGAGYTGVEVAAEINEFTREAARSYRYVEPDDISVILLQGRDRILPELSDVLARFSHQIMKKRGVEIRLNTRLRSATAQGIVLSDGKKIATRTLVATIGSSPNPVLKSISPPFPMDERGLLRVDETLAVPGYPNVWAIGDCAAIPDSTTGGTAPDTAQYALREAKQAARNILASLEGRSPSPFRFRSLGVFVPLGRHSAAAEVYLFGLTLKLKGWVAWWLYRTYYLLQIPLLERKIRVAIDWTVELFFHWDIVQIDTTRTELMSRAHFEAGQLVFAQGNRARSFFIVLDGQVEVLREEDGTETRVATLGKGEFFGEMALLAGGRHTASVRAKTPVDLLVMNGDDFTALTGSSSQFGELLKGVTELRQSSGATAAPDDPVE